MKKTLEQKTEILQKPSATITISNKSIDAIQRKFFNVLLKNAKEKLSQHNEWLQIRLSELKKYINKSEKNKNNKHYKTSLEELKKIEVEYDILKKDKKIRETGISSLLSDVKFIEELSTKEITVEYYLSGLTFDYVTKVKNRIGIYAEIDLLIIKGLKSKYSLILYELCKDYEKAEIPEMTIEEFKKLFGIDNKKAYKLFQNIKKVILTPAIKEINNNENIDFSVSYNLTKQGNAYTHIKFTVTPKPKQKQLEQYKEGAQANILINSIPVEHRTKQLETYLSKCLKDYDAKYLLHQIDYVNNQKPKNYFGYLKKAIEEDYANNEKATIEDKKEAIKQKYQEQINKIRKLKEEKGMVRLRENDKNIFYFSNAVFEKDNLVIYETMETKGEIYSNTVNVVKISLENEKIIQNALNLIEEKLKNT